MPASDTQRESGPGPGSGGPAPVAPVALAGGCRVRGAERAAGAQSRLTAAASSPMLAGTLSQDLGRSTE